MRPADWQPSRQTYDRGLAGLVMGDTPISRIDGEAGRLWYAGYAIEDLAAHASFEEVSYLILNGELPDARALSAWRAELSAWRALPASALDAIAALPDGHDPFDGFQTAMAVAASVAPGRTSLDPPSQRRQVARILTWSAGLAAACIRKLRAEPPVTPRGELDYASHFLWLANGREPDAVETRALEVTMIVKAEHGVHAAALTALTVASAGADLDSAVLAGIGALSGSLHAGANRDAFRMVVDRRDAADARAWAEARLAEKYRFPGYGHRVYRNLDPRAELMAPHAERLLTRTGRTAEWERFTALREAVETALGPRGIYCNVDALTGFIYQPLGLPEEAFTIPFCLAIQTGWMAHCLEYLEHGGPVIEPVSVYVDAFA